MTGWHLVRGTGQMEDDGRDRKEEIERFLLCDSSEEPTVGRNHECACLERRVQRFQITRVCPLNRAE